MSRRSSNVRWPLAFVLAIIHGCGTKPVGPSSACPTINHDAVPGDYVAELAGGAVLTLTLNPATGSLVLQGGQGVFATSDPGCVPTALAPCRITLKRLRLDLGAIPLETGYYGDFVAEHVVVAVETPIDFVDEGTNYHVAETARADTCAIVQGQGDHGSATFGGDLLRLGIDWISGAVNVDGSLPLVLHLPGASCEEVHGRVTGLITSRSLTAQAVDGG